MIEKIKELRKISSAGMSDCKKALEATNGNIDEAIKWLRENGIEKAAKKASRIAAEGAIFINSKSSKYLMLEINSETDFVATNEKFLEKGDRLVQFALNNKIDSIDDLLKAELDKESIANHIASLSTTLGEKISLRRLITFEDKKIVSYLHSNKKIGVLVKGENIDDNLLKDISMHIAAISPEFISKDQIDDKILKSEEVIARKVLEEQIKSKPEKIKKAMIDGKVSKNLSEITLLEQNFVKDPSKKVKDILNKDQKILDFVRYEVGEGIDKEEENFAEEVAKQING